MGNKDTDNMNHDHHHANAEGHELRFIDGAEGNDDDPIETDGNNHHGNGLDSGVDGLRSNSESATESEVKPLMKEGGVMFGSEVDAGAESEVDDDVGAAKKDDDDKSHLLQDHGWAWCVCFGNFFSHVITGGFERSDGVLFLEFTERFHQSAQLTAWPGAIVSTTRLIMGPAATALSNRTSVRTVTMIGTFIFAFGLFISGFAPNLIFLFFSYGLIQGIGRGLVYAPGLVIVGRYFNRRRGFGVGLATAGVGVGTFFFPPLVEWLFQELGYQGAFLVLAGLALNTCIAGALYRPFFVHRNIVLGHLKAKTDEEEALCAVDNDTVNSSKTPEAQQTSELQTSENSQSSRTAQQNVMQLTEKKTATTVYQTKNAPKTKKSRLFHCLKSSFHTCFPVETDRKNNPDRKLIEWRLLKNPPFLFFCFSIGLFTAAFKSAFTFLPALAESTGISKQDSAYLLSISGVLDTIGRILSGLVLDINYIRPLRPIVYNGVIFVIVLLSFLSPYMTNFVEFAVLFGMYGFLTGAYVSQKSVILVDILGEEELSSSFGLLISFQGIGALVGPPLSGLLRDVFGRYHEAFFLGGAAMALAGILMVISNIFRIAMKRKAKSNTSISLEVTPPVTASGS